MLTRQQLMEGNLRGARDLVTPLTAANLKRATSVGSSYASPPANYGGRNRYVYDAHYESPAQEPYRALHAQASSPTMGRDFQNHWRGFSETVLPERPSTALERTNSPIMAQGRIPTKAADPRWTNTLKGSRSYDSLGNGALRGPGGRDAMHKGSPDPTLEPLVEDDGPNQDPDPPSSGRSTSSWADSQDGSWIYRSPSRTEEIREQMSSLKGRISSLRERAREDSLRRQSMHSLREPSPFNNATVNAPEFFYTSSPAYGSPVLDTRAGVGTTSQNNSPATPQSAQGLWTQGHVATGSRNAFAEQAERVQEQGGGSDGNPTQTGPQKHERQNDLDRNASLRPDHKRTPSGTAIVQSSKHRYSHHQYNHSRDNSASNEYGNTNGRHESEEIGVAHDGSSQYDDSESEAGASLYEDAESDPQPHVVAHEDREDAFDYEHFFLHSAMGALGRGARRGSNSSEDSVSSVETARGPTAPRVEDGDGDDEHDDGKCMFPPGTPETPEKLREIERNMHKRTYSDESVSSLATFATATEGFDSPPTSKRSSVMDWPIRPAEKTTRPDSAPHSTSNSRPGTATSRPATAIPVKAPLALNDSSSERADSGVGLNGGNDATKRRPAPRSLTHKPSISGSNAATTANGMLSPPMSPQTMISQDPVTVAVNALLAPVGRPLGLKDKAVLFGLVDSLRKALQRLQEVEEGAVESRGLRRRIDEARRVLDGEGRVGRS